jgi:lipoprotein-anchoring transpeptidase ErfK/SrfK
MIRISPSRFRNRGSGARLSSTRRVWGLAVRTADFFAFALAATALLGGAAVAQEVSQPAAPATAEAPAAAAEPAEPLTGEAINAAPLATIPAEYVPVEKTEDAPPVRPDAGVVRLQVLLDRAGSSPGAIDGFDGDNVRKAVRAYEAMQGLPVDGILDPDLLARIETPDPVIGRYTITGEDAADITGPTPSDYTEMAKLDFLGYQSVAEKLAERFHMDIDLLKELNPGAQFVPGDELAVAAYGPDREGAVVARIEADKTLRQVRAYDAENHLITAYPATIGSEDNPSPSGTHLVQVVVQMPNYTYNPKINFQQGDNDKVLTIPPGPNGPVGAVWIDLTEPTFGIHGTPEPSKIDKTGSHGCIRLTNWDVEELSKMVAPGVPVEFVG